jgi:hypothetical protein
MGGAAGPEWREWEGRQYITVEGYILGEGGGVGEGRWQALTPM